MEIRKLWDRIRSRSAGREKKKIDRHYVSEFEVFMSRFIEEHPEVLPDQAEGRGMYWDRKVDLEALGKASEDTVPTEPYSYFSPFAGRPDDGERDKENRRP